MAQLQMTFAVVALCLLAAHAGVVPPTLRDDADARLTTPELIVKYGYPAEAHSVETSDGYILGVHRIPHGKGMDSSVKRPAILLQHGLMSSSADWVIMGPNISLAYLLADAGYDVWLGNKRGNTYSRAHVSLDPNSEEFWQFSWHQMGVYDLPAVIDYIIQETGQEKIYYVGHSMGTTMFYVMGAKVPEYNDKIRAMVSLAPVAYMSHMTSPLIQLLSAYETNLDWLLDLIGGFEFLPHSELFTLIGQAACNEQAVTSAICSNAIFLVCGFDSKQLDVSKLPAIMGHDPAGSSTMEFIHYGQEVTSGHFREYDYGALKNMVVYGQVTPPDYDLSKVTAPVFLHYSDNDWLAAVEDVDRLSKELGNLAGMVKVPDEDFNHMDYLWAVDAPTLVYNTVMEELKSY
ncbi:lipase 3-like [Periplaneta americana]|uniref:lipase 3-like n=1 Tax=Periplaneta americana TaxID=6978 RepID=UPI0037E7A271